MKKLASSAKSAPKAVAQVRSIAEDREDEKQASSRVDRFAAIVNGELQSAPIERDWSFAVENQAQGMSEIEGQLGTLRAEISVLEQILRPHMPDHLYEPCDEGEGVAHEGYYAANEGSRTPAVEALCELANKVQQLRRNVTYITRNVVV